ncbi:glucokinase [Oricola sp.]|uniref:glucokinase n=1 Tax=Oricola sp. TaxID=1979950 RepID=UPI0025F1CB19|nr:glucokinase [Oricola sp.]MCI5077600.1 glucokinase [Oricola sp.]
MTNGHPEAEVRMPFPVLIADIGGTNARFAIVVDSNAEPKRFPPIKTADYKTLDEAVQTTVLDKTSIVPRSAVLAVAGPTDGDEIDLTNCHWVVRPKTLIGDLGFTDVLVMNDYEAQALAVVALDATHLKPVGGGERMDYANRVVIGPGTGLGVAGIVHGSNTWIPVAGEGGHVDLGPRTERDYEIFPHVETIGGRVSGEQILCGRGLVNLYRAVAAADGRSPLLTKPEEVTQAALDGSDTMAVETVQLFLEYLARVAGDMALVFMARGGIYLTGGITQKILPLLHAPRFRAAFDNKEPHRHLLEQTAVFVITHDQAPLEGLSAFARMPARFGVDTTGRWWRKD